MYMTSFDIISLILVSGYFSIGFALFAFLMYAEIGHLTAKDIVFYFIMSVLFWPMFLPIGEK